MRSLEEMLSLQVNTIGALNEQVNYLNATYLPKVSLLFLRLMIFRGVITCIHTQGLFKSNEYNQPRCLR